MAQPNKANTKAVVYTGSDHYVLEQSFRCDLHTSNGIITIINYHTIVVLGYGWRR